MYVLKLFVCMRGKLTITSDKITIFRQKLKQSGIDTRTSLAVHKFFN